MPKFRKKPVVIEAMRIEWGMDFSEVKAFCPTARHAWPDKTVIPTLEGDMVADMGDWIIKGVAGEFYPCKDEIFRQTYEAVS